MSSSAGESEHELECVELEISLQNPADDGDGEDSTAAADEKDATAECGGRDDSPVVSWLKRELKDAEGEGGSGAERSGAAAAAAAHADEHADGYEQNNAADNVGAESHPTVSRLRQLLRETDAMIDRLQSEVEAVHLDGCAADEATSAAPSSVGDVVAARPPSAADGDLSARVRQLDVDCSRTSADLDRLTGSLRALEGKLASRRAAVAGPLSSSPPLGTPPTTSAADTTHSTHVVTINVHNCSGSCTDGTDAQSNPDGQAPPPPPELAPSPGSTASSGSDAWTTASSDEDDSWGGAFSLRNTLPLALRASASRDNSQRSSPAVGKTATHESVVQQLSPQLLRLLAERLRFPPGLLPCLELEAARYQLGLAVHRHRRLECDRGCEGNDSETSSEDGSSWDAEDSLSDVISGAEADADDDDDDGTEEDPTEVSSSLDSTSSSGGGRGDSPARLWSGSGSDEDGAGHAGVFNSTPVEDDAAAATADDDDDGVDVRIDFRCRPDDEDEHTETRKYMAEKVGEDFHLSTDSESDDEGHEHRITGEPLPK